MSKKHYEMIAKVLKDSKKYLSSMQHWALCRNFGDTLSQTNTKFDLVKFLKACGIEVE